MSKTNAIAKSANCSADVPQEDPVDSWEDIADTDTPPVGGAVAQVVPDKPVVQDLGTNKVVSQIKTEAQSSKSSRTNEKESGNQGSLTTGAPSTSNGNGKKHPSPNLSEKKPGRSESSKQAAAAAALQIPPPKTEDDKENLNIVFIGHVGEGRERREGGREGGRKGGR